MEDTITKISEVWNEKSSDFDQEHDTEDLSGWRKVLKGLLGDSEKVLDIGTGTGFLALMAAELGYESYGIDVAENMLALAEKHKEERKVDVDFRIGEGEKLPFDEGTFDAVINCRVIWTLVEPQISFAEWKRVLKNGGKVLSFIRGTEEDPEKRNWTCYDERIEKNLPLKHASEGDYIREMKKAGYKNVKILHLPEEISHADAQPWLCVYGDK